MRHTKFSFERRREGGTTIATSRRPRELAARCAIRNTFFCFLLVFIYEGIYLYKGCGIGVRNLPNENVFRTFLVPGIVSRPRPQRSVWKLIAEVRAYENLEQVKYLPVRGT